MFLKTGKHAFGWSTIIYINISLPCPLNGYLAFKLIKNTT